MQFFQSIKLNQFQGFSCYMSEASRLCLAYEISIRQSNFKHKSCLDSWKSLKRLINYYCRSMTSQWPYSLFLQVCRHLWHLKTKFFATLRQNFYWFGWKVRCLVRVLGFNSVNKMILLNNDLTCSHWICCNMESKSFHSSGKSTQWVALKEFSSSTLTLALNFLWASFLIFCVHDQQDKIVMQRLGMMFIRHS